MPKLPDYIGPVAFGVKMGVILPGTDLVGEITAVLEKAAADELLSHHDVVCVTESVVARSQNNYVTLDAVAAEIRAKLQLAGAARIGVVFPILSRNRFALILQAIARAAEAGEVIVQLSYPCDEVGNPVVAPGALEAVRCDDGTIAYEALDPACCLHPITRVNYLEMYKNIIEKEGAKATVLLCNDPQAVLAYRPDGVIAADVHGREETRAKLVAAGAGKVITLQELCNEGEAASEWGLLGSNMSAKDRLKLAPRNAGVFAKKLQAELARATGLTLEVLVYGDGAYKDPSTGIYELADPMPVFGMTDGLGGRYRMGVKYKYLADVCHAEGKTAAEIEAELSARNRGEYGESDLIMEGTTPRRLEDVIASLADLVSGSADAGTPVVVVKGIY
ncbi:MAG TPA: hypothetical protein GX699_09050 [Firmicutes bacterium]|nr:hypothetical protein [Bacillota bacterium]